MQKTISIYNAIDYDSGDRSFCNLAVGVLGQAFRDLQGLDPVERINARAWLFSRDEGLKEWAGYLDMELGTIEGYAARLDRDWKQDRQWLGAIWRILESPVQLATVQRWLKDLGFQRAYVERRHLASTLSDLYEKATVDRATLGRTGGFTYWLMSGEEKVKDGLFTALFENRAKYDGPKIAVNC